MGCRRRDEAGICAHDQCPFPEESGYDCVDLVSDGSDGAYCEAGDGCVEACPYSWPVENEALSQEVFERFEIKYA